MKKVIQFWLKVFARLYLRKFKPKIVAVSGSVGKTSTKEAIRLALNSGFRVRASAKSYNNEIGVPLAILGFKSPAKNIFLWKWLFIKAFFGFFKRQYPQVLVLEMGSDKPGDLKYLVSIAKPDIAVLTRIGAAHFQAFEDMDKLIEEKSTLIKVLRSKEWAVLNYDDEVLRELGLRSPCQVLYYGLDKKADVWAFDINIRNEKLSFKIQYKGRSYSLEIEAAGKHFVYTALAAFSVGVILGLEPSEILRNLAYFKPLPGRGRILAGKKQTLIVDESYNANPLSVQTALDFIKEIKWQGRKVLVLGDMKELGSLSHKEHLRLVPHILFADLVIFVGPEIKPAFEKAAQDGLPCFYYRRVEDLLKNLESVIKPNDLILFKASQSIRLEKAVAKILSEKYNPKEVLVRQEKEWQG